MPAAAARSMARAPRSSEPHGRFTVTRSAIPHSSAGRASADATTNRALGRPPRRGDRAARREASAIAVATGSTPSTSRSGFAAARGQHEPAVAGAKVHGHAVAAGGAGRQLADVHLVGSASDHGAHARRVGGRRRRRKRRLPTLAGMSQLPVQPYERAPSAFHPWDPRTADVARELARLIASARPGPSSSTSAAPPSRACRARTWWTWGSRPIPTRSPRSATRSARSASGRRAGSRRSRPPGRC